MRDSTSSRDRVFVGLKLPVAILLAIMLAGAACAMTWLFFGAASDQVVNVLSPFETQVSADGGEEKVWSDSILASPGAGESTPFWLKVTKSGESALGDVRLLLDISEEGSNVSCADISGLDVSNSTAGSWEAVTLGSNCLEKDGHAVISLIQEYDSANPVVYNFSISFGSAGGPYLISGKIGSMPCDASEGITMFGGESAVIMDFSNCSTVEVIVNASLPVMEGDYSLIGCDEYETGMWNCTGATEYELWIETKPGTANTYNVTAFCMHSPDHVLGEDIYPVEYEELEICESEWTECADGVSYKYCHIGSLNTTRVMNCTIADECVEDWSCTKWSPCTGTHYRNCVDANLCGTVYDRPTLREDCSSCEEDWLCSEWGSCRSDNTRLRTCTDLNECGTSESRPEVSQDCVYGGGNGNGGSGGHEDNNSRDGDSSDLADDSIHGWACDHWGPCVNGRRSAFCYKDTRDSGLNYTVSEKCAEIINYTDTNLIVLNSTNRTEDIAQNLVTGNLAAEPGKETGLLPWIALPLLALLVAGGYSLGSKKGWFAAAGRKKKGSK